VADKASSVETDKSPIAGGVYAPAPGASQSENFALPTLLVQTAYFSEQDRESAESLGFVLYDLLTRLREERLAFGPGIPVRIAVHPGEVALDVAQHVVVIPVLGQGALVRQSVREAALRTLRDWHLRLASGGAVLPVLMSEGWTQFLGDLPGEPVPQHSYGAEGAGFSRATLDLALSLCRLLRKSDEDFQIFISHARDDHKSTEHAARALCEFVKNSTTSAVPIDTTGLKPEVLRGKLNAAEERGVFLAVRSDGYGSRHWCQRELLWAKQARLPTLTVEVLRNGEPRSYPYSGNGPTLVWSEPAGEGVATPLRVVRRAAVEWLRALHFRREAQRFTAGLPEAVVLTRPPELLDLAQGPLLATRSPVVLHPDPELSFAEREVLRLSRARIQLVTPTTLYRSIDVSKQDDNPRPAGLQGVRVALSVSDVIDDAQIKKGLRKEHAQDALVHITRALVSAGAAIAYGGDLRVGGYDELFLDLIRSYNEASVRTSDLLHSYLPQTFDLNKIPTDRAFNVRAVEDSDQKLLQSPVPGLTAARSALYLSEMRRIMSLECRARVLLGGQALPRKTGSALGYGGPYPGLVEEAWHTLHPADKERRPLYVVGGFGGAAALVAALGSDDKEVSLLQTSRFPGDEYSEYRSVVAAFSGDPDRPKLPVPGTPEAIAHDIRQRLKDLLASDASATAWNGLTVPENRELFWTQDVARATALILDGLFRVRGRQLEKLLEIELVAGDILRTERANAIVLPVFENVPITGAGAALDKTTGGAVTAARDRRLQMIALTSPQVDANWLVLANLGRLRDKAGLPAIIEEQAKLISELAVRHDFGRISLVTFAGTVLGNVEQIAERMLAGFASLPDKTQLQWFEANPGRFERLAKYLGELEGKVALSRKVVPELEPQAPAPPSEDLFAIVRRSGNEVRCTLLLPTGSAVSHEHTSTLTDAELAVLNRASSSQAPPLEALSSMGHDVARLLFGDEGVKRIAENALERRLVIQHDLESSGIPFETLRAADIAPALSKGLVRRLSLNAKPLARPLQRPPTAGKLRLQLIVNPTLDLPHAEREAEEVRQQLADSEHVDLLPTLTGPAANKEAVLKALTDTSVDVLHYCGHAAFEGLGADGSGLVCADAPITLKDLLQKQIGPRIVFFNACQSARVRKAETTTQEVAKAFAEAVLLGGVDAYLGTFWPVADEAAGVFAASTYLELAKGAELHRAVTTARNQLEKAGQPDWANYLLFGTGAFKLKTGSRP
jgi:hypothetical protein